MKLCRYGPKGAEKPGVVDSDGNEVPRNSGGKFVITTHAPGELVPGMIVVAISVVILAVRLRATNGSKYPRLAGSPRRPSTPSAGGASSGCSG